MLTLQLGYLQSTNAQGRKEQRGLREWPRVSAKTGLEENPTYGSVSLIVVQCFAELRCGICNV